LRSDVAILDCCPLCDLLDVTGADNEEKIASTKTMTQVFPRLLQ
jgi:hypothetical protein